MAKVFHGSDLVCYILKPSEVTLIKNMPQKTPIMPVSSTHRRNTSLFFNSTLTLFSYPCETWSLTRYGMSEQPKLQAQRTKASYMAYLRASVALKISLTPDAMLAPIAPWKVNQAKCLSSVSLQQSFFFRAHKDPAVKPRGNIIRALSKAMFLPLGFEEVWGQLRVVAQAARQVRQALSYQQTIVYISRLFLLRIIHCSTCCYLCCDI